MMRIPLFFSVLTAVALVAGCSSTENSESETEGPLGEATLYDSTDSTGKADAIAGRQVIPSVTSDRLLDGTEDSDRVTVTELTDSTMTVEGPLIRFERPTESLQVTVETGAESGDTVLRFLLGYRLDDGSYSVLVVEGPGDFEQPDDVDNETGGRETTVQLSYFQSISILAAENSITVASDEATGQTTTELDFDVTEAEWAVFVIPVDSGWAPLEDTFDFTLTATCGGGGCAMADEPVEPADAYAEARDVTLAEVTIPGPAPEGYERPVVDGGFGLGGTEFWQRWDGGHSPTFSFSAGTDQGRKCMQASAIRFEAIMSDPPASMVELLENSNWSGRFFNWNDDFTEASFDGASGARLWAWRTGLVKFISQTGKDGTCYLPTLDMVDRVAQTCLQFADQGDGEIQGCSAR